MVVLRRYFLCCDGCLCSAMYDFRAAMAQTCSASKFVFLLIYSAWAHSSTDDAQRFCALPDQQVEERRGLHQGH